MFVFLIFFVFTKSTGVEFDFKNHLIREYTSSLGKVKGDWKDAKRYKAVVILSKNGVKKTLGTRMTSELHVRSNFYELYVMDEFHIKRKFIHSSGELEEIKSLSSTIATGFGIPLEKYQPRVSSQRINKR